MRAPPASSDAVRRSMLGNRSRDTGPERRLRSELHRLGLRFRKHYRVPLHSHGVLVGGIEVDVAFPRRRVAVFVDGTFWHRHPLAPEVAGANAEFWAAKFRRNVERDRQQAELLGLHGWRVVRVWEGEAEAMAAEVVRAMELGPPRVDLLSVLFARSAVDERGCWEWQGAVFGGGYGRWPTEREGTRHAHRVAYALFRGPLPAPAERNWVELDHLCRNRRCVNPWHLELVSRRENVLRGNSFAAAKARQETCVNGHSLTGGNLYNRPDRPLGRGRGCRICRNGRR